MARRATYIKQVKSETSAPVILLDSGNALFGTTLSINAQGEPIIEAMNAIGYDAMNISAQDLALGLDILFGLRQQATFPFISANLVKEDGSLVFQPYTILSKGDLRIGVIGVIEPIEEILTRAPNMQGVVNTLDAVETVKQYVAELQGQADVVVVLSHLGITRDKLLAQVPGINVIIGGGDRMVMEEPTRVNGTVIVQQGYQGEWIGRTVLAFGDPGQTTASTTSHIPLTDEYPDDPGLADLVRRWNTRYPTPTPEG